MAIVSSLSRFPKHASLIGEMLVGYGELEFAMTTLVQQAIKRSISDAARVVYRMRGAQNRIDVSDALLRPFYKQIGLNGPYGQWLGAMRRCRVIRNQYAHCTWYHEDGRLLMAELAEAAQPPEGPALLTFTSLELPLVKQQYDYFEYTHDLAYYLKNEGAYRIDRRRRHKAKLPTSLPAPRLGSPRS